MSRIKEQYEYLQWQIQSLTNDLNELGQRMDNREAEHHQQQLEQQESNNGR